MTRKDGFRHRTFSTPGGGTEHFIFIDAPAAGGFAQQLAAVEERYAAALSSLRLPPGSAVFRRVFLDDLAAQSELVRGSSLGAGTGENPVAVSIVRQPPRPPARLALLAYHIQGPVEKSRPAPSHLLVRKGGLRHLWSAGLQAGGAASAPEAQMRAVFGELIRTLAGQGGTLLGNCLRTWIYISDVDNLYQGMVAARRDIFEQEGLNAATHYIASTGIEGACGGQADLVALDAYSVLGLKPGQVSYLNDFSRLCPANDYGVTFERGTRVAYADRAHLFVSGTASIDSAGAIVYPGDAMKQLARALENVAALLKSGRAGPADLMYLIVYLRDPADFAGAAAFLEKEFPDTPLALVRGAVCRPGWLVEAEGVAVTGNADPSLPSF